MLYIRQHKPTLNTQDELFKLIIRNVQLESSITRDKQKYLKPTKKKTILAKYFLASSKERNFKSA